LSGWLLDEIAGFSSNAEVLIFWNQKQQLFVLI